MYLKPRVAGHLPTNPTHFVLHRASLFFLHSPIHAHGILMAHLDDADADLHATPTSCGSTPSLNQIPVPERVDVSVPRTPTDDLSVGRKQDYTSGPRTSTRPEESPCECDWNPLK